MIQEFIEHLELFHEYLITNNFTLICKLMIEFIRLILIFRINSYGNQYLLNYFDKYHHTIHKLIYNLRQLIYKNNNSY